MSLIQVLIAGMPALDVAIVARIIEEQDDMTLVGTIATVDEEVRSRPDVVLTPSVAAAVEVLWRLPQARLIALGGGPADRLVKIRCCDRQAGGWQGDLVAAIRHTAEGREP
jgi:hypothetical protein